LCTVAEVAVGANRSQGANKAMQFHKASDKEEQYTIFTHN